MAFNWFRKKKKRLIYQDNEFHTIKKIEMFNMLLDFWPKLSPRSTFLSKEMYIMPSREDIEKILAQSLIDEYDYTASTGDTGNAGILICGDYGLLLHADVIKERYKDAQAGKIPVGQLYALTFGQIWFQDYYRGAHAVNLAITHDEGILFALPQIDEIRKPEKGLTVDFIRM